MRLFIDQTGREVAIPELPLRIVSTVPSQTELLFDLGLDEQLMGITWFCIHPHDKVKSKTKIGGTKNIKLDIVRSLKPDLIIANKEENEKVQIEALALEYPVWISDIHNLNDSLAMINEIGDMCGRKTEAIDLANNIASGFSQLRALKHGQRALYLIWKEPYMSIGNDTFIHYMMEHCGFQNVLGNHGRYPILSESEIKSLNPEIILLSSEPYPFKEKHIKELQALLPGSSILLVDGEMFSWYGSRLLHAPAYLQGLITSLQG